MRFIKIVGRCSINKQQQNINSISNDKINIVDIDKELKNGQLYLYIKGDNIENKQYEWNIMLDDQIVNATSLGSVLILNKANTLNYIQSAESRVVVTTKGYTSKEFKI